ncbi:endolytic transglycosylase MltG [Patescibacteria group bacterium]|nr:endolytic transglycosylase MltG [Patescibacteria group bacterium]
MKNIIRKIILILIIVIVGGWLWYTFQIAMPLSQDNKVKQFEIKSGSGVNQISQQLYDQGLIRSKFYFELHVWLNKLQRNFIRGTFSLSPSMNIKDIVATLTDAVVAEKKITIIEGWNLDEIADYLEKEGLIKPEEFLSQVKRESSYWTKQYAFLKDKPANSSLEGYLFPDTYRVFKNSSASDIVEKMLDNFNQKLNQEWRTEIINQGKSIYEVLTLASIIEKEVASEDMSKIADVFLKRLKENIPLQSDATINYITKKGKVQPSLADLKIDHLYNTYMYKGLPPGPIANPGLNAIEAVIYPTTNSYYYFLTTKEGEVIYSKTFAEHSENKKKYLD